MVFCKNTIGLSYREDTILNLETDHKMQTLKGTRISVLIGGLYSYILTITFTRCKQIALPQITDKPLRQAAITDALQMYKGQSKKNKY